MPANHPNAGRLHRLNGENKMGFVSDTIKKIAFWNYERTSWQWDVLCVLILVFIFLTPKSWFANTPKMTVIVGAEVLSSQPDELERRVREMTKRPNGQVLEIRPHRDASGKLTGNYEVDIR